MSGLENKKPHHGFLIRGMVIVPVAASVLKKENVLRSAALDMGTALMALAIIVLACFFFHLMFAKYLAFFYVHSKQQLKENIMINKQMLPVAYLFRYTPTNLQKNKQVVKNQNSSQAKTWVRRCEGPSLDIFLLWCVPLLAVPSGDTIYKLLFSENQMKGKGAVAVLKAVCLLDF